MRTKTCALLFKYLFSLPICSESERWYSILERERGRTRTHQRKPMTSYIGLRQVCYSCVSCSSVANAGLHGWHDARREHTRRAFLPFPRRVCRLRDGAVSTFGGAVASSDIRLRRQRSRRQPGDPTRNEIDSLRCNGTVVKTTHNSATPSATRRRSCIRSASRSAFRRVRLQWTSFCHRTCRSYHRSTRRTAQRSILVDFPMPLGVEKTVDILVPQNQAEITKVAQSFLLEPCAPDCGHPRATDQRERRGSGSDCAL